MRRLYGLREGLLTAALIALGPYFLVTASVGIYDAMVTGPRGRCRAGLAPARAEAPPVHRAPARQPARSGRPDQADGVDRDRRAAVHARPLRLRVRRSYGGACSSGWRTPSLAVGIGYAITSHRPLHAALRPAARRFENHRAHLSEIFDDIGPTVRANWPPLWNALHGYLTLPGRGARRPRRRRRRRVATAPRPLLLAVWTVAVLVTAVLLALWAYPRYFATAIVPLSGFVALGALAVWDFARAAAHGGAAACGSQRPRRSRCSRCCPPCASRRACSPTPSTRAIPASTTTQYVTATSAQTPARRPPRARSSDAAAPTPCYIDVALGYP